MLQRKTTISLKVIDILEHSKHPISAKHILLHLKKIGILANKTTIYRILKKLVLSKKIREITHLNGITLFEKKNQENHYHFICKSCDSITCLDSMSNHATSATLHTLLPSKAYSIEAHELTLYGKCEICSA